MAHPKIIEYRKYLCPDCGAGHKYGHLKKSVICYRCGNEFEPMVQGVLVDQERLVNFSGIARVVSSIDVHDPSPQQLHWARTRHCNTHPRKPDGPLKSWLRKLASFIK